MKSNFNESLKLVLKHEGGFVNHPKDPGGATNKGVTLYTYTRYIKRNGTVNDLKNITDSEIQYVYKKHYWDACKCDHLPSGCDYAIFDFAVNSGPRRAIQFAQRVLEVEADGMIGPKTIAAFNKIDPKEFITQLCDNRLKWLKGLQTWKTFGKGWSNRVKQVKQIALDWVK